MTVDRDFNYRIDNMRALAIILVVYAHSVIIYDSWGLLTTDVQAPVLVGIRTVVNRWHMPLFCFISGFLFFRKLGRGTFKDIFINKFKRVIIPYFAIALLWMIPIRLLIQLPIYQGKGITDIVIRGILLGKDNGHLWYLIYVFMAYISSYVLYGLLEKMKVDGRYSLLILFVISVFLALKRSYFNQVPVLGTILYRYTGYYTFFCFGMLAGKFRLFETALFHRLRQYWFLTLFVLAVFVYLNQNGIFASRLLVGFWVPIAAAVVMPDRKLPIVSEISKESFGIYLFHSPLVYITFTYLPNIHPLMMLIINFICLGTIAFMMNRILSKTHVRYLIGYWK